MPKFRFGMRGMMVAVAALAVVFLGIREYRIRAWAAWVESINPYPVEATKLSVKVRSGGNVVDQAIAIDIEYDFKLTGAKLPAGTKILLWVDVAIQDAATKTDVDGYTLSMPLKVGERENASGRATYFAIVPRPGVHYLRHQLQFQTLGGEWKRMSGGSSPIQYASPPADSDQATRHQGVK